MGSQLLDALHHAPEQMRARIGLSVLLHELFHFDQGLQTSTYRGIGRAGFVLEEIDYWADAFVAYTLAKFDIDRKGPEGLDKARDITVAAIDVIISGIEAFDHAEHGGQIAQLSERRLRRYLIWHLHRSRAESLRNADQMPSLFDRRLVVELSLLRGRLDERGDKLVDSAGPDTELMAAYGGDLIRISRSGYFEPASLVDAVRSFDRSQLEVRMRTVRDSHRRTLIPWVS